MYYNYLDTPTMSLNMQSVFGGINKNARTAENEFTDMVNMTSDKYPLLAPRKKRTTVWKAFTKTETVTNTDEEGNETTEEIEVPQRLNGILGDVGFAAVWGTDFYYMGKLIEGITLLDGEKNLVAMGAKILIFPDAVFYDTVNGEYGEIDKGAVLDGTMTVLYFKHGTQFRQADDRITINIDDGSSLGLNKSFYISGYKEVDTLPSSISKIETVLFKWDNDLHVPEKVTAYEDGYKVDEWKKYDISAIRVSKSSVPQQIADGATNLWSGNIHIKYELYDDEYLIETEGKLFEYISGFKRVNSYTRALYRWKERTLPTLDYVCVHENRLWGCHYGTQVNTYESVNEIYCSAQGKFDEWTISSTVQTTAGAPYAATVGDYGAFTGCVSHRGYVLFFKEDVIYRVSGTKPANFIISQVSTAGVQEGSAKSIRVIDEILYYKARNGVYAYDGSLPQKISYALSDGGTDAIAGEYLNKYYVSMVHDGARKLYVYDTRYGLWHGEDNADIKAFTEYDGALYAIANGNLVCMAGDASEIFTETETEGSVKWSAQSGDIGLSSPYQKYYHRLLIRLELELNSRVKISIETDNGEWLCAADFTAPNKRTVVMPIVTPRCDHMRLRIEGEGEAKIYSIAYETETASERPSRR